MSRASYWRVIGPEATNSESSSSRISSEAIMTPLKNPPWMRTECTFPFTRPASIDATIWRTRSWPKPVCVTPTKLRPAITSSPTRMIALAIAMRRRRDIYLERLSDREAEGKSASEAVFGGRLERRWTGARLLGDRPHAIDGRDLRRQSISGGDADQLPACAGRFVVKRPGRSRIWIVSDSCSNRTYRRESSELNSRCDLQLEAAEAAAVPHFAGVGENRPLQQLRQHRTPQTKLEISYQQRVASHGNDPAIIAFGRILQRGDRNRRRWRKNRKSVGKADVDRRPQLVLGEAAHSRRSAGVEPLLRRHKPGRRTKCSPEHRSTAKPEREHVPSASADVSSRVSYNLVELQVLVRENCRRRMTGLQTNHRSARRGQQAVGMIARHCSADDGETLSLLDLLALRFLAQVEDRAEERGLRLGTPEMQRVGEIDRRPRQPAPGQRRHATDRRRSEIRGVLRHALAEDSDGRNSAQAEEHGLAEGRTEVVVETVAEHIFSRGRAQCLGAVERPADADLGNARVHVEAAGAPSEVVVDELATGPKAVERSVADADTRGVHRGFGESHPQSRERVIGARSRVGRDRYVLIRLGLVEGALRVEDLALAEEPPRIEPHDTAHDSGRYLLVLAREGRHFDPDLSNPRSRSRRDRERIPRQQQAVVHGKAVYGIRARISVVVQALANGIGGGVQSEAVESRALANGEVAHHPFPFRHRFQTAHHERSRDDRRSFVDLEPELDGSRVQLLHYCINRHPGIPPTPVKDYQPGAVVGQLDPVQTMFDSERKVEVTPRPCRRCVAYGFGEIGVGKGGISLELQSQHLDVPAVAANVLTEGGFCSSQSCEKRECGRPEPDSALRLHPFSARLAGGWPGGSSRP